ncbi:hypothetical protein [Streptacidiphilus sp. EB103A]|uniref:hypothetical protein n=1 Tax=Streptacidiphilus sp. EB103A TaxID=3156275 RepID=UPI003513E4E6
MQRPVPGVGHLKLAVADADGAFKGRMSASTVRHLLGAGFAYAEDADRFVLEGPEPAVALARRIRITALGRFAALTEAQSKALVDRVDSEGAFERTVTWPTVLALVSAGLAEYRDNEGCPAEDDGDTGLSGPVHRAYRTELGAEVVLAGRDT